MLFRPQCRLQLAPTHDLSSALVHADRPWLDGGVPLAMSVDGEYLTTRIGAARFAAQARRIGLSPEWAAAAAFERLRQTIPTIATKEAAVLGAPLANRFAE